MAGSWEPSQPPLPASLSSDLVLWMFSFPGFHCPPPTARAPHHPFCLSLLGGAESQDGFGLEGTLKTIIPTPLPGAGTSSTRPGVHVQTTGELQTKAHGWWPANIRVGQMEGPGELQAWSKSPAVTGDPADISAESLSTLGAATAALEKPWDYMAFLFIAAQSPIQQPPPPLRTRRKTWHWEPQGLESPAANCEPKIHCLRPVTLPLFPNKTKPF